jgi:hypothetical protein
MNSILSSWLANFARISVQTRDNEKLINDKFEG